LRALATMALLLWISGIVPGASMVTIQATSRAPAAAPLQPLSPQAGQSGAQQPAAGAPGQADGGPVYEADGELERFGVRIVEPGPDDDVSGRVRVTAEVVADRPAAVSAVDFFVDGRLLFSDAEAPYELLWNAGRPADHLIEVRAYGPGRQMVSDVLRTKLTGSGVRLGGFSVRVERVELHVRVEGDAGATRWHAGAFEVIEDGVPQPVAAVERVADLPLAVGLLIDHSGSMLERIETALTAAGAFVEGLLRHPNDKAFVLGFADTPVIFQEFTNDTGRLADSIALIGNGHYTALYDAIVSGARRFSGIDGRRAVVLLTDGADQGSDHDLREAIAAAQRADVAIYPLAVELSPRFVYERWVLYQLAEQTGGRVFSLGRRSDPAEIYGAIEEDLRAQYRISYAPLVPGGSGEWRELEIRVVDASGDARSVRARPGYFAQ